LFAPRRPLAAARRLCLLHFTSILPPREAFRQKILEATTRDKDDGRQG
jgi:hypothetical protein